MLNLIENSIFIIWINKDIPNTDNGLFSIQQISIEYLLCFIILSGIPYSKSSVYFNLSSERYVWWYKYVSFMYSVYFRVLCQVGEAGIRESLTKKQPS